MSFQKAFSAHSKRDDAARDEMLEEFDLLSYIRSDVGEQGQDCGEYIAFHNCTICGTHDCLRYYPETNTFYCFDEAVGGTAIDYYMHRNHVDVTEAFSWLREQTGHPLEDKHDDASPEEEDSADSGKWLLRAPEHAAVGTPSKRQPAVWDGILRRGHLGLVVGKGKVGKTAFTLQAAVIVASGGGVFFEHELVGGRVLFVNPEVDPKSFRARLNETCKDIDAEKVNANLEVIHLRGVKEATLEKLARDLRNHYSKGELTLIVLDSVTAYFDGDENSSPEVRHFLTEIENLAYDTQAATLAVHHTGKARAGDLNAADRARGASAWLDKPDALLTLCEVLPPSGDPSEYLGGNVYACVLEAPALREFPRMKPVRMLYDYPFHRPDDEGVIDKWKLDSKERQGGQMTGQRNQEAREQRATLCEQALMRAFIADGIGDEGIGGTKAASICSGAIGETVKPSRLKEYISEISELFEVQQVASNRWNVVPSRCTLDDGTVEK